MKPISVSAIRPEPLDPYRWRLPRIGSMRTDGVVYADHALFQAIQNDEALAQVCNVATLPGIVGPSMAMPDIHWGYGFPIGGVAAFDEHEGIISPGGVGFDISCGVRLLRSAISVEEVQQDPQLSHLANQLFERIPSGVGVNARRHLRPREMEKVMIQGAGWPVAEGFGQPTDLEYLEEGGCIRGADPGEVSERALERGARQLGTLGSGNHFLELQKVDEIFDAEAAKVLGLVEGSVAVSIHTGSRGFGYQICEDHLRRMVKASAKYGIDLPDRQLCCAPLQSPEGRAYLGAMACAANFAFANRQVITQHVREVFEQIFGKGAAWHRLSVVYDVCHNLAKVEAHRVGEDTRRVCVHRKGATRALPPGHPELPAAYRGVGQPVLIPGDMGRYSYVLCANAGAAEETFSSSCHGAGRVLSRKKAKALARGRKLLNEMEERGVLVRSGRRATVAEEMPEAYKDVADVVRSVEGAALARRVARLVPFAVIKG